MTQKIKTKKQTKKQTQIVRVEESRVATRESEVSGFISQAIEKGLSIEVMEKLFALKERNDANIAKEAFVEAMAKFQAECPVIKKTAKVMNKGGGSVRYKYAPLDVIVAQVKKPLGNNNFSYSIETTNKDNMLTSTCKATHSLGHSETSEFAVPIDKDAFMSDPQKYASASTFSKRYAFCNVFGILTGDEDNDAQETKTAQPTKTETKPRRSDIDVAENFITSASNIRGLKVYKKKLNSKESEFTPAQKKKLNKLIDKRLDDEVEIQLT